MDQPRLSPIKPIVNFSPKSLERIFDQSYEFPQIWWLNHFLNLKSWHHFFTSISKTSCATFSQIKRIHSTKKESNNKILEIKPHHMKISINTRSISWTCFSWNLVQTYIYIYKLYSWNLSSVCLLSIDWVYLTCVWYITLKCKELSLVVVFHLMITLILFQSISC